MSIRLQITDSALPSPEILPVQTLPAKAKKLMDWPSSLPFVTFHVLTLVFMFSVDYSWKWVGVAVFSYYLRMFAITAGYHRYFSHRTYSMGRFTRFWMGFLGAAATQKGPLWWAAHHRHHHRYSDKKEDIHSPVQEGFWRSHLGWILSTENHHTRWHLIKDLSRYPELVWLNKYHLVPAVAFGAVCTALGGWNGLVWGYFLPTIFLWHGVFTINSLAHVWGSRTYHTEDTSRNNLWLAILTLGEGWHNNHHCYMNSANQGFRWWQVDGSYYLLKLGSYVGIFNSLKKAPLEALEVKKIAKS
jgi:stearoyl-CoA desaturase (delta-9 desaturase)